MTTEELRKLTKEELIAKLAESKKILADAKFNIRINKETDFSIIKKERKDIARMLTIINEKKADKPREIIKKEKISSKNKNG